MKSIFIKALLFSQISTSLFNTLSGKEIQETSINETSVYSPYKTTNEYDTETIEVDFSLDDFNETNEITKKMIDENNEIHTFTVEISNLPNENSNLSLYSSTNKYTVRHNVSGTYQSSFNVDIRSNSIIRAYNKSVSLNLGTLSNHTLVRNSTSKATHKFVQTIMYIPLTRTITATLSNNTLRVTAN